MPPPQQKAVPGGGSSRDVRSTELEQSHATCPAAERETIPFDLVVARLLRTQLPVGTFVAEVNRPTKGGPWIRLEARISPAGVAALGR